MDSQLVDKIVHEVKSQGVFDEFRRNSIADVDTKPAYQNLRQRVENTVKKFLSEQKWSPDINKIQLRERLRKHITDSGFLEVGVERIVDQVVNPKIFQSRIEDIAYKYLGVPKPFKPDPIPMLHHLQPFAVNGTPLKIETSQLLPTDLEQVSPDSDKATIKSDSKDDCIEMDIEDKLDDDDESPPFEPLEHITNLVGSTKKVNDGNDDVKTIEGDGEVEVDESERRRSTLKATIPTNVMCSKQKLEYDSETQDTSFSVKTDDQDLEKDDNRPSIEHQLKFHESQSQLSQVSSNSRLSIGTEENNDREQCRDHNSVNICEEAQMPKFNENSNDDAATLASSRTNVLHFDIKQDEIKFEGTARKSNQSLMDLAEVASASAMMEVDAGPQKHINIEDIRCPSTKDDSISNEQLSLLKVKIDGEEQEHHHQHQQQQQQQSSNSETDFVSSPKIAISNNHVQRETGNEMKKETHGGEEEEEDGEIVNRNEEENVIGMERVASGGGAFNENGSERDEDGTKTTAASPSTSQSQSQDDRKHATKTKGERSRGHERRKEKDRRKSREKEKNRHRSRKSSTSDWSKQSSSSSRSQSIQPASSPADKMATASNSKDSVTSKTTKHHSSSATGHGHSSKGRRHGHAEKKRSHQQPSSSSSSMDRRSGSSSTDRRSDIKSSSVQGDDHYAAKEKITWRKSTDSNDDDKKPDGSTVQRRSGQYAADESTGGKQNNVTDTDNKGSSGGGGGSDGDGTSTSPTPPSPSAQQCENTDMSNATKTSCIITSNIIVLNNLRQDSSADVVRMPPTSMISDCEMESIDNIDDDFDEGIANLATTTTTPTITENSDQLLFFDDNSNNMEFMQRLHVIDDAMECCRHIIHDLEADDVDGGEADDRSQFVFIEDKETMKNATKTLMHTITGGELEMGSKRLKRVTEAPSPTASSSSSSSDASVNSKENEFTAEDIGDLSGISISLMERKGCTLHKLSQQQRYSTEELYKPRPFLGQRSRRRGLFNSIA